MKATASETATDAEKMAGAGTTMFVIVVLDRGPGLGHHRPDGDDTVDQDQNQGRRRGTAEGPPGETGAGAESGTLQTSGGATTKRERDRSIGKVQLHPCGPVDDDCQRVCVYMCGAVVS